LRLSARWRRSTCHHGFAQLGAVLSS
jgi:aryl carrier-like protein